jgi:hypothetical protein
MRMGRINAEVTLEFENVAVESKVLTVMYFENSWIAVVQKMQEKDTTAPTNQRSELTSDKLILYPVVSNQSSKSTMQLSSIAQIDLESSDRLVCEWDGSTLKLPWSLRTLQWKARFYL